MTGLLIALVSGVAAYLLTKEIIVGLLVGAVGFWLFWQMRRRTPSYRPTEYRTKYGAPTRNLDLPRHELKDGEGIAVVCKQVTPQRQEWVSVKTGRLFDVLSPDGPPDAKPGDPGEVFVYGTRCVVKTPVET